MNTNIVLCGDLKKKNNNKTKTKQKTTKKNSWSLACYKTNQNNRQNGAAKKQLKLFVKERGEGVSVHTLQYRNNLHVCSVYLVWSEAIKEPAAHYRFILTYLL